jgi:nickel transport protein
VHIIQDSFTLSICLIHKSYFRTRVFIAWIIIIFITASPIYAHKLNIFAFVVDDTVFTESHSADGTPVQGGVIKVVDNEGLLLLNGETDEGGLFSFRIPKRVDLTIILEESTGHRASYRLSAAQLAVGSHISESKGAHAEPHETGNSDHDAMESTGAERVIEIEDIRSVVAEEVAKQLEPLHKGIARLQKEGRLPVREIFAGIGYILGLMGLVMYFQSRRKK